MSEAETQEQLEFNEPGAAAETPPEPAAAEPAVDVDALQAQLAEAQRRESEANRRLDEERQRFDSFLERAPHTTATPEPARVDPASAPDPAVDPDGFRAHQQALLAQQTRDIQASVDERLRSVEAQNNASVLWTEFLQRYPDYASRRELAGIAFNRLTKNGLPSDTSGLIDNVKAEMDRIIGSTPTSDPQPTRTGGVSGGSAPPKPPAPEPAQPKVSSLGDEISAWQLEHGYI